MCSSLAGSSRFFSGGKKQGVFFFNCPTDNIWESIGFMSNSQKTMPYIFNGGNLNMCLNA